MYKRGTVLVVALHQRTDPPNDWVFPVGQEHMLKRITWWDVMILDSDEMEYVHTPGKVTSWAENMLTDDYVERIA